jgi:ribosomal protein S24E
VEDNPSIVTLLPDEFNELLSEYQNFFDWNKKKLDIRQRELAERVLAKLRQADAEHVCVDEETVSPDVSKEFPITSVTRADLLSAGFAEAVVANLTDSDMQQIASAMEDVYCDHGYWEDLELCTNRLLKRKEEDAVVEHDEQPIGGEDGLT